jgi:hypothetical protein
MGGWLPAFQTVRVVFEGLIWPFSLAFGRGSPLVSECMIVERLKLRWWRLRPRFRDEPKPHTLSRFAGRRFRRIIARSASFTSSHPARRPNELGTNRSMHAYRPCQWVRRVAIHSPSRSSRVCRRVRDRPAIQHPTSPPSRETGASGGGQNLVEGHPIPIHP